MVFAALAVLAFAVPAAAQTFPELTSRVVDDADIIDIPTEAEIDRKLAELEQKTTSQLVVVTVPSLQGYEIEDYGYRLGRHWGIGQKDKDNGALLIVAPNERKVRVEVGYGLEGTLTDAVSALIIQNAILPRFRAGDMAGGISRGVDDLIQVIGGDTQYAEQAAAQRQEAPEGSDLVFNIIIFVFVAFYLWRLFARRGRSNLRRRRRGSSLPWIIPTGGWSSGGGFGGGGGWSSGGGFSGGGGGFGGGGSSGSW